MLTGIAVVLLTFTAASARIDTAWVRRHNPLTSYAECANAVVAGESGSVYVAGISDSARLHYVAVKYDPAGNRLWVVHDAGTADSPSQRCYCPRHCRERVSGGALSKMETSPGAW